MALLTLNYDRIKDTINDTKTVVNCLSAYIDDMNYVCSSINNFPGSDDHGYTSGAASLARQKLNRAIEKRDKFDNLSRDFTNLYNTAMQEDASVSESFKLTMTEKYGNQNWFERMIMCCASSFMNFVTSWGEVGKKVASFLRSTADWIVDVATDVKNWFKYGAGKYVLQTVKEISSIVLFVAGAIAAVAAAVAALAAFPVALAIIGTLMVTFAAVYLAFKIVDAGFSIAEDANAIMLYSEGDYTASRYYGETDGVSGWIEKHDLGDREKNLEAQHFGQIFDVVRDGSKLGYDITSFISTILGAGLTKNIDGSTSFSVDKMKNVLKFKNLHKAGGYADRYQNNPNAVNWGKFFKLNIKDIKGIKKEVSTLKKINSGESVNEGYFYRLGKSIEPGFNLLRTVNGVKATTGEINSGFKSIKGIVNLSTDIDVVVSNWDIISSKTISDNKVFRIDRSYSYSSASSDGAGRGFSGGGRGGGGGGGW